MNRFPDQSRDVYEEVNTSNNNCVTMITVMPGTMRTRATVTSSPIEATDSTSLYTRESEETSSSEGGSFIIDSAAFYENLNFHRMIVRPAAATSSQTSDDLTLEGSKFGYSQKEVWNWLYTDHDMNHNRTSSVDTAAASIIRSSRPIYASKRQDKAVEVKFTLSEFVDCYKRLLSLNLEGFTEFVNRTLEALISTSAYYAAAASSNNNSNFLSINRNAASTNCCQQPKSKIFMVPSLHRSNKTYVRLSVRRPLPIQAFTCYQTLIDVNDPETGRLSISIYFTQWIIFCTFFLFCSSRGHDSSVHREESTAD